ncbi:TPA: hypothetical protein EYP12_03490, partial [Candidatus Bipolaricaulota bacterium]|nr:hypothetical protein [Candidatus Bipolaricaulota bacterium]
AVIDGEAGAGKTRLVQELASYVTGRGGLALIGSCHATSEGLPYQPLIEALRNYLSQASVERLRQLPSLWLAEVAKLIPELGELLDISPNPPLSPDQEKNRLFTGLTEFIGSISQDKPMLLFLDDLHWVDRATLRYLSYLAHYIPQERILVVGTYRTEEVDEGHSLAELIGQLYPKGLMARLTLKGLAKEEVANLLKGMLGLKAKEEEFSQRIFKETEGNPFFVVELVKSLIEGGVLYPEGEGWHILSGEIIADYVPATVREVIRARLRRVSQRGRELLSLAAVAGREFDLEVLSAADGYEEELLEIMDELLQAHLVLERDQGYEFGHELIRQVVYEGLSSAKRRNLHLRIGRAMESVYAQQIDEVAGELAQHFYQAERWQKALD